MKFKKDDFHKFIRFSIVGVGNTLINWTIFFILNACGVYYVISNIIAWIIATLNSYIWNSLWVFKYKKGLQVNTSVKFFALNIAGMTVNTTILYMMVDKLGFSKLTGLIVASIIVVIMNYTVNKLWVFRDKKAA